VATDSACQRVAACRGMIQPADSMWSTSKSQHAAHASVCEGMHSTSWGGGCHRQDSCAHRSDGFSACTEMGRMAPQRAMPCDPWLLRPASEVPEPRVRQKPHTVSCMDWRQAVCGGRQAVRGTSVSRLASINYTDKATSCGSMEWKMRPASGPAG
jgi:hypothetical protein